jgi:hypothetical protein
VESWWHQPLRWLVTYSLHMTASIFQSKQGECSGDTRCATSLLSGVEPTNKCG